jgi:hypothetical protein
VSRRPKSVRDSYSPENICLSQRQRTRGTTNTSGAKVSNPLGRIVPRRPMLQSLVAPTCTSPTKRYGVTHYRSEKAVRTPARTTAQALLLWHAAFQLLEPIEHHESFVVDDFAIVIES